MDTFKTLKTLTETPGPSGNETAVGEVIQQLWEPLTDTIQADRMGSVVATKFGNGPEPRRKLLLAAHLDEIALMVSQVISHNDYGFLRVTSLGGIDRRHLYGQQVIVHGKRDLIGVVGAMPMALVSPERRTKPYDYEELVVDVGLPIEELVALVSIGDFITFRQPLRKLMGKRIAGKSVDNRASVTAVTHCLEALQSCDHSWDVLAAATSQEETRLMGAYTSGYSHQPDAAIAVDVTWASGGGLSGGDVFDLGSGPILDIGPNVHVGMFEALNEAASALEMKVSIGTHNRVSGTDANALQVVRMGLPTAVISIPMRNMHTMVESLDLKDIERVGRLLTEFIVRLDDSFLQKLTDGMMTPD